MWQCRCDCGDEPLISYNDLLYTNVQSCGCSKKSHNQRLHTFLSQVDGTNVDILKSKKIPKNNTTGCKGVYLIRGKFVAKIAFQKKVYYLGAYDTIDEAIAARKNAEALLFDGTAEFYRRWKAKADKDPTWAAQNPVRIEVSADDKDLKVAYYPEIM